LHDPEIFQSVSVRRPIKPLTAYFGKSEDAPSTHSKASPFSAAVPVPSQALPPRSGRKRRACRIAIFCPNTNGAHKKSVRRMVSKNIFEKDLSGQYRSPGKAGIAIFASKRMKKPESHTQAFRRRRRCFK
jgi:hypothetical protein